MELILVLVIGMMGASIFSFLNVVVYRFPRKISFVKGTSKCESCGHRLYLWDMVPIFSWFILGGKCKYCHAKISIRSPLVELLGGVCLILLLYYYGYTPKMALLFVFFSLLTVIALIDQDTMEIPNEFVIISLVVGLVSLGIFTQPSLFSRILGIFVISVPMLVLALVIPGAFGGGDIKLMAACGILLGVKLELIATFIAIMLGGSYGAILLMTKKKDRKDHFAFGPFLCIGMAVSILWGNSLVNWYLALYGL